MSVKASTLPVPIRLLNALGELIRATKLRRFKLEKHAMLREAMQKTGLTDFGDPRFENGLQALLASAGGDSPLHFVGQIILRQAVVENLTNRLLLVEAHKRTPEVFEAPLIPPLIVLGLHRSGTTHLHRLLAEDPAHHAPPYWELTRPLLQTGERDNRREVATKLLARRKRLLPGLDPIHVTTVDLPEECVFITASSFDSVLFWLVAPVQGYAAWYMAQEHTQKYTEYRAWLQVLQWATPGKRLVMKAPEHTGALAALLHAVPDVQIVQTHRDPVTAYASFNSFVTTTHALTTTRPDLGRIAETNLRLYETDIGRNLAARAANPDTVHDVSYDDLVADPVGTVAGIYARFGLDLSAEHRARLTRYVQTHPKAKHGAHTYALENFGVSREQVRTRLAAYYEQFEV